MAKFNTGQSFADGDQVTGAKLNNIIGLLDVYSGVIADQTSIAATVSTADLLLIADTDAGSSGAANKVTIQKLLNDTLTNGTYTNAQLSGNLNVAQLSTLGTISSTRGTIATLNSTTGTIAGLSTTTGTVATLNSTTGTITGLNSTNGTVQTLTASTATITGGTYSGAINSTTGTVATLNSTTGTITNLRSTTGTVATLNSTTGTITGLNTTTGTIATLNSTTGTITNLSTTLAGDFTISQGTGAVGSGKITFPMLSTSATEANNVAKRTAKAWVYFDASGTITNDFNVTSVTASHGGLAGRFLITFTANVTNPVVLYTAAAVVPESQYCHQFVESVSSSSVVVQNLTDIDGRAAPSVNCIAIFGDA